MNNLEADERFAPGDKEERAWGLVPVTGEGPTAEVERSPFR